MKVAVIGSGIAGISAAWHLQQAGVDSHLFEASARLGGHTHTHAVETDGKMLSIDTGFIVFNRKHYPQFSAWLDHLNVPSQPTDMSFGVRDEITGLEYGTADVRAITANVAQLCRPGYWRLWRDLMRFYREAAGTSTPDITLAQFLIDGGYSDEFSSSHILPMCAALWSQPAQQSADLSLPHIVEFMSNHDMLRLTGRPQWRVVTGGSASYLQAFERHFAGNVQLNAPITRIRRATNGVYIDAHETYHFDAVVLACHSNQALAALAQPSKAERDILGALPYHHNEVYLHRDPSFMPRKPACWSSWNVVREADGAYTISYWMNRLQNLQSSEQFFVTLNPPRQPTDIVWRGTYEHPNFNSDARAAQARWREISHTNTWYAGAYWGAGFHEDGFTSGKRCAEAILAGQIAHAA